MSRLAAVVSFRGYSGQTGSCQLGAESRSEEPLGYCAVLSFFAGLSECWVRGGLSPVAQLASGDEQQTAPETKP